MLNRQFTQFRALIAAFNGFLQQESFGYIIFVCKSGLQRFNVHIRTHTLALRQSFQIFVKINTTYKILKIVAAFFASYRGLHILYNFCTKLYEKNLLHERSILDNKFIGKPLEYTYHHWFTLVCGALRWNKKTYYCNLFTTKLNRCCFHQI